MRVLCCFTAPHPATVRALAQYAPGAGLVDVTGDEDGYWRALRSRWDGAADLVTVEQDIEIDRSVLPSFAACPGPWCVFAYPIFDDPPERCTDGLGCARFTPAAQQAIRLADIRRRDWQHLDGEIARALTDAGFVRHVHGDVVHHHVYEERVIPPPEEIRDSYHRCRNPGAILHMIRRG